MRELEQGNGQHENRGRPEKYPWDLILNGTKWLMEHGIDFDCDPSHFRERAYLVAKQRGIRISCHLAGNNIVIRALILAINEQGDE